MMIFFRDTFPTSFSCDDLILTAIGEIVASIKLGIPKTIVVDIIDTNIKFCDTLANLSISTTSKIGIIEVVTPAINIKNDTIFIFSDLSAIFPPS